MVDLNEADATAQSARYEETHVHEVYEQIASHFSSTRYKPWPIVQSFLLRQSDGAVGLDIGCGNGKYLSVNPNVFVLASDRSSNLVKIASQHRTHEALVADNLDLPHACNIAGYGSGRFDFAISIAVVHHLSTPERRQQAIRAILQCLRPNGQALIYVWALEQKSSRRGWDESHDQDVMVPWLMKTGKRMLPNGERVEASETTFQRYYHLYKSGELERDVDCADGKVLEAGYEKDNWWAVATTSDSAD